MKPMDKISNQQAAALTKVAASTLRALSEENTVLREKVASYERQNRAEKIAAMMEEKGINTDLDYSAKVASIMERDDLTVLEEAVGMSAPQMKLASVHEDGVEVESTGDGAADQAAQVFAANLASLE
jgi:DNA polymerase I-like protein with 3'-5' exonuclease and polymerase domains